MYLVPLPKNADMITSWPQDPKKGHPSLVSGTTDFDIGMGGASLGSIRTGNQWHDIEHEKFVLEIVVHSFPMLNRHDAELRRRYPVVK